MPNPYTSRPSPSRARELVAMMTERLEHEDAKKHQYGIWSLNQSTLHSNLFEGLPSPFSFPSWMVIPVDKRRGDPQGNLVPIINQVSTMVRTDAGALSQSFFSHIVPKKVDYKSIFYSQIKQEGMYDFFFDVDIETKQLLLHTLQLTLGDAFLKVSWDKEYKPHCRCYEKWQHKKRMAIRELMEQNEISELAANDIFERRFREYDERDCHCTGYPMVEVCTPWEIILPRNAISWPDGPRWYNHRQRVELGVAQEHYSEWGNYKNGHLLTVTQPPFEIAGMPDSPLFQFFEQSKYNDTIIDNYVQLPDRDYPRGRLVVMGNSGKLPLHDGPLNYPWIQRLNLFKFGIFPKGNSIWSDTYISQVLPIQYAANDFVHEIEKILRFFAMNKWVIPSESGVDSVSASSKKPLIYDASQLPPGHYPHVSKHPGIPQSIFQVITFFMEMANQVANFDELRRGNVPSEVTSGKMLNRLLELSGKWLKPLVKKNANEYSRFYNFTLAMMEDGLPLDHFEQYTGQGTIYTFPLDESFRKVGYNVRVEPTTVLSESPFAKTEQLIEAKREGLIPPEWARHIPDVLDYGGIKEVKRNLELDRMNAESENQMWLMEGFINDRFNEEKGVFEPYPFEDLEVHLKVHIEQTKKREYLASPVEQQQILDMHIQATLEKRDELQMREIMKNRIAYEKMGSPPKPGPGGEQGPGPGPGGPIMPEMGGGAPAEIMAEGV